jgi:hypothetical protein
MKNAPCSNYITRCSDSLIDLIIQGLQIITFDEDDDDDDWGHSLSAAVCLQKLSILIKNDVMPKIVEFSAKMTNLEDWKPKYAGLIALGCIAEGPEKTKFFEMV